MADRFPAVEDLDETSSIPTAPTTNGNTSADDFLARERAALGDDAAQFASAGDDDLLGGGDDLLGGGGGATQQHHQGEEIQQFEKSFPGVDTRNDSVGPGGTITGSDVPFRPQGTSYGGFGNAEEESEPLRLWREKRDESIASREKISASKKEETVAEARKNIDEFYENYSSKTEKGIARTKKDAEEFLANRVDTTSGGTSWDRIAKLVDLSKGKSGGGAVGKEKFRDLLLDLRKDEQAPGAKGV